MDDEVRKWAAHALKLDASSSFWPKLMPWQKALLELLQRGERIELDKPGVTQARAWKTHIAKLVMMAAAREGKNVFQARLEDGKIVFDEITDQMPYDEL